jgi:hypothetical protein
VDLREIGFENGRWIEMVQNIVSWRALVLATLDLLVLVPETWIIEMDLREINCGDGRWIKLAQDRIQWLAVIFTVLNFRVLLPELVNY